MSDKKVCEVCPVCGELYCALRQKEGRTVAADHWERGYKRLAAILTPEVLRLIEAGREVQSAAGTTGSNYMVAVSRLADAALAVPFEGVPHVELVGG